MLSILIGIVTRIQAGEQRTRNSITRKVQAIFLFCKTPKLAPGPTQPHIQRIPGAHSPGVTRLKREANHLPHLVSRLRMNGAIPPFSCRT